MGKKTEKRKRGRPVQSSEKKEEIRLNIINVAKKLFAEEGYEHISIRKIANQAGCVPRTIYYYFKNKRELLNHLWLDIFMAVSGKCKEAASGVDDPISRIKIYFCTYINYWLDNPDRFRVIFMNEDLKAANTHDEKIYETILNHTGVIGDLMAAVETCIETGIFPEKRKEIIFQTIVLSAHGLSSGLITMREVPWQSSEDLIHSTCNALVSGMMRPSEEESFHPGSP